MIYGLILAGGIGHRMGSELPKQFIEINERPIIGYTIDTFVKNSKVDRVVVLVPEEWIHYTCNIIKENFPEQNKIDVIAGGALRNDTIMKGIEFIEHNFDYDSQTVIMTHDAVRPFVTQEIINGNINAMGSYIACDTVIPATDTIVHSMDGEVISHIPDRAELYQGQTPQTFNMKKFKEIYISLNDQEKNILTDAAKAFVIKGEKVGLVKGSAANIKVTYPSDLKMAEAILRTYETEE